MVKANELRVGNVVELLTKRGATVLTIENVAKEGVNVDGGRDGYLIGHEFEDLRPIPLTPEILEGCGFNYAGVNADGNKEWSIEPKDNLVGFGVQLFYCYNDSDGWQIAYFNGPSWKVPNLHQLQNVYFALTGEELTVHLPQTA